ncbi:hypothetical protein [Lamprobacter modestohalophilus]|uniref:hypothetical protein n=1 Tax=Lamprobacter modestohalophilus TaxID=1064514 RepID=UPI0019032399|nr:hypothetical protein [Lamprobacter modestohalophilus]
MSYRIGFGWVLASWRLGVLALGLSLGVETGTLLSRLALVVAETAGWVQAASAG